MDNRLVRSPIGTRCDSSPSDGDASGSDNYDNFEPVEEGRLRKISKAMHWQLRKFYYGLGFHVADKPYRTMGLVFMFTLVASVGLFNLNWVNKYSKLWIPANTISEEQVNMKNSLFHEETRPLDLMITGNVKGQNIANRDSLLQVVRVLRNAEFGNTGDMVPLHQVCVKIPRSLSVSYCAVRSVLDLFFNRNATSASFLDNVENSIEQSSNDEILSILSTSPYITMYGQSVEEVDLMSNVQRLKSGEIHIEAFRVIYLISLNGTDHDKMKEWETKWVSHVNNFENVKISARGFSIGTLKEAVNETLTKDRSKLFVGMALLILYVCCTMGEFHRVRSRSRVALMGILSIILGLVSTAGIASAIGWFFGPIHQILPLLIVGVGIDDAYVIVTALDEIEHEKFPDHRFRIAKALSTAGTSITVTSITNATAFLIGGLTEIPATRYFALWAAIGVTIGFLFQCTFFVAFLSLDVQRREANRIDLPICCCKISPPVDDKNVFGLRPGVLARFFAQKFAPFILNRITIVICFLFTCCAISISIYGITQLEQVTNLEDFFMDGSAAKEHSLLYTKYFGNSNEALTIITTEMDYSDPATQAKMHKLLQPKVGILESSPYVTQGSIDSWYLSFREQNLQPGKEFIDPSTYYTSLQMLLKTRKGFRYTKNIVFNHDGTGIIGTSSTIMHKERSSSNLAVEAMNALRDEENKAELPAAAFPIEPKFIYNEEYARSKPEAIRNVCMGIGTVFFITLLLLGNFTVACITFVGVATSVVYILGILHFWEIHLNSASVVTLALVIGLTIDFSAHIGVAFMDSTGTNLKRVHKALASLGPALFYGGTSTFLAVSMLAFASSHVYQVFFKMFFMILGFGMLHGLLLVPQLLFVFGPAGYYRHQSEKDADSSGLEKMYTARTTVS